MVIYVRLGKTLCQLIKIHQIGHRHQLFVRVFKFTAMLMRTVLYLRPINEIFAA